MKKEMLLGAIALLISAGVMAQTTEPTQTQSRGDVGKEVRDQAKLKGEAQKSMKKARTASKNKGASKSVRTNRPATVKGAGAGRR
ncbi:MAG: hypothetical protein KBB47_01240 [Bacteroidales bacterium]|jgi:hypothetical protein|nr:hypothetical protein [Bacteroidales bacterium]